MNGKTISIAGKNEIAIDVVNFILEKYPDFNIKGIVNSADKGVNGYFRSYKWFLNFKNIPEINLDDIYECKDLIFISLEFDKIIDPAKFVSKQLYNIHFSLLPAYKGMYTSAWPILNHEKFSGVTLHEINRGIDTGDIIDQQSFELSDTETVQTLYRKYLVNGTNLMKKNLQSLIEDTFSKRPQTAAGSTYYSKKSIDYKFLKISLNVTAAQLDAQIRAFSYREYQIPIVHSYSVNRSTITTEQSTLAPGRIMIDQEEFLVVSTIDFNVTLFKDRFDQFIEACKNDDLKMIENLFHEINLEERTNEGWTPLIVACYNNSVRIAKYLLDKGADVNAKNYKGTSVLMYAKNAVLNSGLYNILDIVLSYGPDLYSKDFYNKNIFDYLGLENQKITKHIKDYTYDKIS